MHAREVSEPAASSVNSRGNNRPVLVAQLLGRGGLPGREHTHDLIQRAGNAFSAALAASREIWTARWALSALRWE
eukprot:972764-Alexandrium_andersonii.AAC.1